MKNKVLLLVISLCALFLALQSVNAQCSVNIASKDTASFMNEIPSINTQLSGCPIKSPIFLYKNGNFLVNVNGATTSTFTLILKNGFINGVTTSITLPSYTVTLSESDFDSFLQSNDKGGTFAQLYKDGKVTIKAHGFLNNLRWWITRPFIGFFTPKAPAKFGVGEVCQHGGECETGNCIYDTGEGPNRIYRCSCDPFKLDTASC